MWNSFTRNNDPMEIKPSDMSWEKYLEYHGTRTNDGMGDWYSYFQILSNHNTCSLWSLHILMSSEFNCTNISPTYYCIIINQQQEKRWTFTRLLIFFFFFFLMGIFLKHLWLIPNILKWQNCKIFTNLVPSQNPSRRSYWKCFVKKDIFKNL